MTGPAGVVHGRRFPGLTRMGRAGAIAAAVLLLEPAGSELVLSSSRTVAIGVLVACVVDMVMARIGFQAQVRGVTVPTRATIGTEVTTRLAIQAGPGVLATIPRYAGVRPTPVDPEGTTIITAPLDARCVHRLFFAQLFRMGPLGLGSCTQRVVAPLAEPLVVLPAPTATPPPPPRPIPPDAVVASSDGRRGHGEGPISQLREHQPADGLRSVHWNATARRGGLVAAVREAPERVRTDVVVDLEDGSRADEVVARTLGLVRALLDRGDEVTVATWIPRTQVNGPIPPVTDPRAVIEHLCFHTVRSASMRDIELVLGSAAAGPAARVSGPAYLLSATGDRWVDGRPG